MTYPYKKSMMKSKFLLRLTSIIWICTLFVGCSSFNKESLAELSGSELPQSIHLHDEWAGLSPSAPIIADYKLTRKGDNFEGKANFSAGGYWSITYQTAEEISVPIEIVKQFLEKLSECALDRGEYIPYFDHTDDYPSIVIDIKYPSRNFEFMTSSQGEKNIPWKLTIKTSSEYVINSGVPFEALEILRPYLRYDVLDQLIQQAEDYVNQLGP